MESTQKLKQAVKEYQKGRKEAFTILYEESSKYIYTCIYNVMHDNEMLRMLLLILCRKLIWKSAEI